MRSALLVLAACGATAPVTPKVTPPDPLEPIADKLAKEALDRGDVAGLTIAIARRDGATLVKGYGEADRATHARAQPDTVYRIGSLTKQFTAAAILQLAEQGKLAIDDDISKYVTIQTAGHNLTIRELLNHTSGMPSYTDLPDFPEWAKKPATPAQIVDRVAKMMWEFDPGTHFHYTNTGYVVLGMIVEKVSGQRYADYLRDHVFAPAKLAHTTYCTDTASAKGYSSDDGKLEDAAPLDLSTPFSAGALCSTAPDLLAWSRALASGLVVTPASYADMITPPSAVKSSYGLGLEVDRFEGHREIWHNGGINGFVSEMHVYPDDGVTIVVLTNTESGTAPRVAKKLAYAALGLQSPDVALPDAVRDAVAGTYDVPNFGKVEVVVTRGRLELVVPNQPRVGLEYRGNDAFVIAEAGIKISFRRGADTKVSGLTVEQGGQKIDAPRVSVEPQTP